MPLTDFAYFEPGLTTALTTKRDLEELCLHAVDRGAFELRLVGGEEPWACINSKLFPLLPRRLTPDEVRNLVEATFSARTVSKVLGGSPDDPSLSVSRGRELGNERFRVNISAAYRRGESIMMVLRHIPAEIPSVEAVGLPQDIVDYVDSIPRGVVMFVGATGTGKSTSLAALIRHRLENGRTEERVVTAEAPVEFVYDAISGAVSVAQLEVGRHIESFKSAIENYLRQNPTIFLLGESRDKDTIDATLYAGMTGPLVFTTAHANDIPTTIPRLLSAYPRDEQFSAMNKIVEGVSCLVAQTLLDRCDKEGRIAVREKLIFTPEVRRELRAADPETIGRVTRDVLARYGMTMVQSAEKLCQDGIISEDTLIRVKGTYGD